MQNRQRLKFLLEGARDIDRMKPDASLGTKSGMDSQGVGIFKRQWNPPLFLF